MKRANIRLSLILVSLTLFIFILTGPGASSTLSFSVSIKSEGQMTSGQENGKVEIDFLALVNAERASLNKNPLTADSALGNAAYLHSKDMGDNNYFSHISLDGRTFDQRIVAAGYSNYYTLGENIAYAYGPPSAAQIFAMWKNSPGHYANMIGDFNDAGLGVYSINGYTYYTLDLGRKFN